MVPLTRRGVWQGLVHGSLWPGHVKPLWFHQGRRPYTLLLVGVAEFSSILLIGVVISQATCECVCSGLCWSLEQGLALGLPTLGSGRWQVWKSGPSRCAGQRGKLPAS